MIEAVYKATKRLDAHFAFMLIKLPILFKKQSKWVLQWTVKIYVIANEHSDERTRIIQLPN